MGAAQDRFSGLMKTTWAPALRDLGMRGSGMIYTLPDERDWSMLGFQSSSGSTGDEVKFTINLLVVGKAAWDEARAERSFYSAKPNPNIGCPPL